MMSPKVTVLMSVYNGERFLREAIESILTQTFIEFEFLIIDDGSTDATGRILSAYAKQDKRIWIVTNEMNIGLTKSLNKGLELAKGEYIARMDADDVSLPERLEKQYRFIIQHKDYALVGSSGMWLDDHSVVTGEIRMLSEFEAILGHIFLGNILMHPSAFMEKQIVMDVGKYDETFLYAQDYDLWFRILARDKKFYNLPDYLIKYRSHHNAISSNIANRQEFFAAMAVQRGMAHILRYQVTLPTLLLIRKLHCASGQETLSTRQKLALMLFLRMFRRRFKKKYSLCPFAIQSVSRLSQDLIRNLTKHQKMQSLLHALL